MICAAILLGTAVIFTVVATVSALCAAWRERRSPFRTPHSAFRNHQ